MNMLDVFFFSDAILKDYLNSQWNRYVGRVKKKIKNRPGVWDPGYAQLCAIPPDLYLAIFWLGQELRWASKLFDTLILIKILSNIQVIG